VKNFFEFFCERGGHVTSAAILDLRIFPEKSEEKKGYKKICAHVPHNNVCRLSLMNAQNKTHL
jgi:hypothetical protein